MANAHNDPGPEGLKMFNIGYLAGIAGILLAWNSAILFKVTISDQYIASTARCLGKTMESKPFYPITVGIVLMSVCLIFTVIITRRTKTYLSKLQDSHLCNLPAKNVLTYIDTLILFCILAGLFMIKLFCVLFWKLDIFSFDAVTLVYNILSMIADDIGIAFIFPIYLIIKTKRYLPKLWDDSKQIIGQNNDFFSINPATVAPASGPQATNQQMAESSL